MEGFRILGLRVVGLEFYLGLLRAYSAASWVYRWVS